MAGPGRAAGKEHHVNGQFSTFAKRIDELKEKGVFVNEPFVAGQGWRIAYFDLDIWAS